MTAAAPTAMLVVVPTVVVDRLRTPCRRPARLTAYNQQNMTAMTKVTNGAWIANGIRPPTSRSGRIVAAPIAATPIAVQRCTSRCGIRSRKANATGISAPACSALVRSLAGPNQAQRLGSPLKGRATPKNKIRKSPLASPAPPLMTAQRPAPDDLPLLGHPCPSAKVIRNTGWSGAILRRCPSSGSRSPAPRMSSVLLRVAAAR